MYALVIVLGVRGLSRCSTTSCGAAVDGMLRLGRHHADHGRAALHALLVAVAARRGLPRAGRGGRYARRTRTFATEPAGCSSRGRRWRPVRAVVAVDAATSRPTPARRGPVPQRPTSILAVTLGDFGGGGFRDADFIGTVLAMLVRCSGLFGRGVARDRIELQLRTARQFRYEAMVARPDARPGHTAARTRRRPRTRPAYAAVFFPLFILIVAGGISRFVGRWLRFVVLLRGARPCRLMGAYHGATAREAKRARSRARRRRARRAG